MDNKGQGAMEYLLIIGGVIIIAIIVIFIIITTSSSSRDTVDTSQDKLGSITDSAIFPPRIKSVTCDYNAIDTNIINFNLNIFESPTPGVVDYCLYLSGESTDLCNTYSSGQVIYDYNIIENPIDSNAFNITLVSKSDANLISEESVAKNCYIR